MKTQTILILLLALIVVLPWLLPADRKPPKEVLRQGQFDSLMVEEMIWRDSMSREPNNVSQ